jgi:hypothetical protein
MPPCPALPRALSAAGSACCSPPLLLPSLPQDELFEILTLVQLKKLGSKFPVPVILVDYDDFYSGLLQFLRACDANGTVGAPELRDLIVAQDNAGVLEVLRSYYALGDAAAPASPAKGVYRASSYIRLGGNEAAAGGAGL